MVFQDHGGRETAVELSGVSWERLSSEQTPSDERAAMEGLPGPPRSTGACLGTPYQPTNQPLKKKHRVCGAFDSTGRREWDRTTDHYHVKVVLYH
jgi:hypothetical protein